MHKDGIVLIELLSTCALHKKKTVAITMKQLSPLAQQYKEAFDGYMLVFDIDGWAFGSTSCKGTLWWFWMDTHPCPPVKPFHGGFQDAYDSNCVQ